MGKRRTQLYLSGFGKKMLPQEMGVWICCTDEWNTERILARLRVSL